MHRLSKKFRPPSRFDATGTNPMVLIIGATGQIGAPTVRELLATDVNVVALVRDIAKAHRLFGASARLAVREFAFSDSDSLARAMVGADAVFVALGASGEQGLLQRLVIDAVALADVALFVRLAVLGTDSKSLGFNQREHAAIETYQAEKEVVGTSLRPSLFHTSVLGFARSIQRSDGWVGTAPSGAQTFIDPRDVASAAAAVLGKQRGWPRVLELPGPELLTYADVAGILTFELGRTISYHDVDEWVFRAQLRIRGASELTQEMLICRDRAVMAGELERQSPALEELILRPPIRMAQFVNEHRDAFMPATETHSRHRKTGGLFRDNSEHPIE